MHADGSAAATGAGLSTGAILGIVGGGAAAIAGAAATDTISIPNTVPTINLTTLAGGCDGVSALCINRVASQ